MNFIFIFSIFGLSDTFFVVQIKSRKLYQLFKS